MVKDASPSLSQSSCRKNLSVVFLHILWNDLSVYFRRIHYVVFHCNCSCTFGALCVVITTHSIGQSQFTLEFNRFYSQSWYYLLFGTWLTTILLKSPLLLKQDHFNETSRTQLEIFSDSFRVFVPSRHGGNCLHTSLCFADRNVSQAEKNLFVQTVVCLQISLV